MTGFTPELDRIERLCWGVRDGSLMPDVAAKRILEASGIAELTEALERIAKHGRKKLRRPNVQTYIAEAALAKARGEAAQGSVGIGSTRFLPKTAEGINPDALALREALEDCRDYFESRADADLDETGYTGNEEMRLLVGVKQALVRLGK